MPRKSSSGSNSSSSKTRSKGADTGGTTATRKRKPKVEEIPVVLEPYEYRWPSLDEGLEQEGMQVRRPYKEKKVQLPKWLPIRAYQPPFSFSSPVDVLYPKRENPEERAWVSGYRIFNPLQELTSRKGLVKRQYKTHTKDLLSRPDHLGVISIDDSEGKVVAIKRDRVRPHQKEDSIPAAIFFDSITYRQTGFIQLQDTQLAEKEDLALGMASIDHSGEQIEVTKDDD